jgi:hypothetical protein
MQMVKYLNSLLMDFQLLACFLLVFDCQGCWNKGFLVAVLKMYIFVIHHMYFMFIFIEAAGHIT